MKYLTNCCQEMQKEFCLFIVGGFSLNYFFKWLMHIILTDFSQEIFTHSQVHN